MKPKRNVKFELGTRQIQRRAGEEPKVRKLRYHSVTRIEPVDWAGTTDDGTSSAAQHGAEWKERVRAAQSRSDQSKRYRNQRQRGSRLPPRETSILCEL